MAWNGPLVTLLGLALAVLAGLLLVRLTPLGGVLFVVLVVGGVATVLEPLAGLALVLFLGPLWAYLRAEVPSVPAQIAQVFVALTLVSWLARKLAHRSLRIPRSPLLLPLLAFFGAALLSLWDAVELPIYGVPELLKWAQIVLLFLFVSDYLSADKQTRPTPRRLAWLVGTLLIIGLFQAGMGMWQFGLRGEGPEHFAIMGGDFYRAYGTFEQPNPYAGYLGMTASLAIGIVVGGIRDRLVNWYTGKLVQQRSSFPSTSDRKGGIKGTNDVPGTKGVPCIAWRPTIYQFTDARIGSPSSIAILGGCATLAMLAALGMSWSRGAWLGFGAAVLAMAAALPRKTRWGLLLVTVLVVGGLGLYAAGGLPASVTARLTDFALRLRSGQAQDVRFKDMRGVPINDANYAVVERLAHWQAALEMFRYNLWTGVGLGCYEPAYADRRHPFRFALINWPIALGHAHNYYLNLAAETGLIGLVAYLLLWGAVLWQTWQVIHRAKGLSRGIAIGLLGAWTHLSVHHLLDNLYVNNVHLHIGVLLGLLAWLVHSCSTAKSGL